MIQVIERAAAGDRDAFDVLVAGSLDRLYAVAKLILRDADLAQDAVQEALVHCWRQLPRLRDPARFDAWLHRLLINAANDQHRRRRRFHASVAVLEHEPSQRDFSIDFATSDEVRAAFDRLRLEHRTVLVLHHYLGLAPDEIADMLAIPHGTVKSRLHYAGAAMRAILDSDARRSVASGVSR